MHKGLYRQPFKYIFFCIFKTAAIHTSINIQKIEDVSVVKTHKYIFKNL